LILASVCEQKIVIKLYLEDRSVTLDMNYQYRGQRSLTLQFTDY
jgi:hypothetical protein